jgi:hypothetical protein
MAPRNEEEFLHWGESKGKEVPATLEGHSSGQRQRHRVRYLDRAPTLIMNLWLLFSLAPRLLPAKRIAESRLCFLK